MGRQRRRKRGASRAMGRSSAGGLTTSVGTETDVAPLGRAAVKTAHERTADEERDVVDWDRVAATGEFRALITEKVRFIVPATLFFVVYYFALPVLVGYAPAFMKTEVFGVVNLAYLFALSQFFMAWLVAALYLRAAGRFDRMAQAVIANVSRRGTR